MKTPFWKGGRGHIHSLVGRSPPYPCPGGHCNDWRSEVVEEHIVDPEHYEIEASTADLINRARQEARRVVAVGTTTTRALEDSALRGGGKVTEGSADATTFIYPGFRFQVIGALMTNFHVPRSSLLMLVSAFAGREAVLNAYREAIAHRYRFYSYGDAMLIL